MRRHPHRIRRRGRTGRCRGIRPRCGTRHGRGKPRAREECDALKRRWVGVGEMPDGNRWDLPPKIRFATDSPMEGAVRSEPVCKIGLIPGRFWANSWFRLLKIVKRQHPVVPHRPAWEFLNPCLQGFFTNAGPRWPKNLPSIKGGRSSYARVLDQKQSGLTGTYLSLSCRGIYRDPIATSITIDNCNARPSCSLGQLVPRHGRPRSDLCSWRLQSVVVYERSAYRM